MLRHFATMLVAVAMVAGLGAAARAQDAASPQDEPPRPPPVSSGDTLIDLNEAIRAYLAAEREDARRMLELILQREPENIAGLYFLGLIYLEEGLAASGTRDKITAKSKFELARAALEKVSATAEKSLVPVESAIELGIAQLASDTPGQSTTEGLALSRRAAETLRAYTEQTDVGKTDRYGWFFLGVAHYRIAAGNRSSGELRKAADEFARAMELARADKAEGRLSEGGLSSFETIVLYYQGLIDLTVDDKPAALQKMQQVVERGAGSTLAGNATDLIKFMEEEQQVAPTGIVLKSPIGPLQFEGRLSIGTYYDSNVILLGRDTALPRGIPKKDDFRLGVEAGFDVSRTLVKKDGIPGEALVLGLGGTTFHFWQPSIGEFDINDYSGRAYVNWELVPDLFAGIQYDYAYTQLGHDPYISSNRITAAVSKLWRTAQEAGRGQQFARTDIFYSYDYRDYKDILRDNDFDRDGRYHGIGVTQGFNLWKARELWPDYYAEQPDGRARDGADAERTMDVSVGYLYRDERTHGREFDLNGNSLFAGLTVPLPWRLSLDLGAGFTWDDYNNPSVLSYRREPREDFIQRYTAGLTRILIARGENQRMPTLDMRLRGGIEVTYQDSNIWDRLGQDVYEFNRFIYSLTLQIRF